jgi:hypothetical protein
LVLYSGEKQVTIRVAERAIVPCVVREVASGHVPVALSAVE